MSGWAAICFVILASAVNKPEAGILALIVYAFVDSPNQRIDRLESKIKELARKVGGV